MHRGENHYRSGFLLKSCFQATRIPLLNQLLASRMTKSSQALRATIAHSIHLDHHHSVLLRNLSDNPNLVYGILHAHKAFEDLGTFTLARGLREIRRIQQAKEERAKAGDANADKGKERANPQDEEQPHEEKARLLRNEGSGDYPSNGGSTENVRANSEDEGAATMPLMSPTLSEHQPLGTRELSEKARGKMRAAGRSLSGDMTGSLERLAAAGVGRNGFVPTQEWVSSWHQG